jgi:hypothetical protein
VQGIFNAKTETSFAHFFSPAGTAWASGDLTNYASLTYVDWNSWAKFTNAGPRATVGVPAVVHLISDDIYLGVTFTSWGGSAGLFSYTRTTPHVTPPVQPIPLSVIKLPDKLVLTWTNASFALQASANAAGPYTNVIGATSPYTNSLIGTQANFRLIH